MSDSGVLSRVRPMGPDDEVWTYSADRWKLYVPYIRFQFEELSTDADEGLHMSV